MIFKRIKNIDIFGAQIQFLLKGQRQYKTMLGAILTIIIFLILSFNFFSNVIKVYIRSSPIVYQQERQVDNPQQFVMNSTTTQFSFGMEYPNNFTNFIDPSIYTIKAYQMSKNVVFDPKTNQKHITWEKNYFNIKQCSEDNFQNPNTRDNFLNNSFQNLYCFDKSSQLVIQGDYLQDNYDLVYIEVYPCQKNCKSQSEIESILGLGYFAIYFSDIIVDPQLKDFPFKFYNRDIYWATSLDNPKIANMYYRNNYVESDFGWVFPDLHTQKYASFSYSDLQQVSGTDFFIQVIIRFEKQKENIFYRNYLTIQDILSRTGGFAQSLIAIGFLLSKFLSQGLLYISLVNEFFTFQKKQSEVNKKDISQQQQKLYSSHQNQRSPNLLNIIKKLEELDKIKKIILSEQQLKLFDLMQQPIKEEELLISDEEDPESQNDKQKQQLTKIQEGFEAYASITKQFEQSEIDTKIIQNLDPQLLDIFNQNQQTQFLQEQKINNKSNQVIQNQQLSAIIKQIDVSTNFSPMKIDHDTQIDDSSKNQSYIQKLDKFTLLKDGSCNNSSNIKNNQDQDYDEVIQINCNESKAKDNQITNNRSFTNECSLIVFSSNTTQNKFD